VKGVLAGVGTGVVDGDGGRGGRLRDLPFLEIDLTLSNPSQSSVDVVGQDSEGRAIGGRSGHPNRSDASSIGPEGPVSAPTSVAASLRTVDDAPPAPATPTAPPPLVPAPELVLPPVAPAGVQASPRARRTRVAGSSTASRRVGAWSKLPQAPERPMAAPHATRAINAGRGDFCMRLRR